MCEYIRVENLNYKNENIERKYLNRMQNDQFLKVNNSLLELEKYFIELKDRKLKDREVKIKKETEELFSKPIIVSIDKFGQKEMKKIGPIKSTWYDWLIIHTPDSIKKRVGGFKDKIVGPFKTSTPKQTPYWRGKKLSKPKTQSKLRKPFILKKKRRNYT